jgi:hypothetical protein
VAIGPLGGPPPTIFLSIFLLDGKSALLNAADATRNVDEGKIAQAEPSARQRQHPPHGRQRSAQDTPAQTNPSRCQVGHKRRDDGREVCVLDALFEVTTVTTLPSSYRGRRSL